MEKSKISVFVLMLVVSLGMASAQEGLIQEFRIQAGEMSLERLARPGTPFDKVGRKFAILGDESGSFEAWAYPLKILRDFEISFFLGSSTRPIKSRDIVRSITVSPEATILTYTFQSFTVRSVYITPINEPGAVILLDVDSTEPLTIVCGFLPVLEPMWPAGIGGQYAYWDNSVKAYVISESRGQNHGMIGSPAASGLSYTPAHMLSETPNEFQIKIPEPEKIRNSFIPIYMAGGPGNRKDILEVYSRLQNSPKKLYLRTLDHFRALDQNTLQIDTPDKNLNLAFRWAKVAFDNLIVDNPTLGKGLVAGLGASGTSGRPGFGWYFGGDAYINSMSLISYGEHQTVRDILAFTQKWQRDDGKMAHELSQAEGYVDWWNQYHYGYIHGDTTPYYIVAMYDYLKKTGDTAFIEESWESLKRAYEWCLDTDANGDGLMDNKKAGLGALEYGALTGIETDIYLAAVWTRAAYAMQHLAAAAGEEGLSQRADRNFQRAQQAFDEKFWDQDSGFYAYAFNSQGDRVREISPWNAVGLMWQLGAPERSLLSLERISSAELTTDWGIRSISENSRYFQPLNYNYGAVWPFLTSWVTTALYKHHLPLQGHNLLLATAQHTFDNTLGAITEVFSGILNVWPQEAVSHQGFSTAGVVLPLVRGLMGLEGDAIDKKLSYSPHFPGDWEKVIIENYKIGEAVFRIEYSRHKNRLSVSLQADNAEGFQMFFAPAFGIGTEVTAFRIDGRDVDFRTDSSGQTVQPWAEFPIEKNALSIEVHFVPTLEILPVFPETRTGDRNSGLKILSLRKKGRTFRLSLEGLANKTYTIRALNLDLAGEILGAERKNGKLFLRMPEGPADFFVKHQVSIEVK
jgi:hypothetical protein